MLHIIATPFQPFTTNQILLIDSLKNYFSTFGEVQECTVMRDGASGRSRGFGFLTFKDPKVVNVVMVKEHFLDGKIVSRCFARESRPSNVRDDINHKFLTKLFLDRPQTRHPTRRTRTDCQDLRWRCLAGCQRCHFPGVFHAVRPRRRRNFDDRQGDWPPPRLRVCHFR